MDNIDHTPHVVTLLIEASLFGLFTAMVLYDQVYAIIDDEVGTSKWFQKIQIFSKTAVEARKRETGKLKGPARKRQVTNLTKMREVFGPGSYWGWLLPRANRKGSTSSPMLTPLLSYSVWIHYFLLYIYIYILINGLKLFQLYFKGFKPTFMFFSVLLHPPHETSAINVINK